MSIFIINVLSFLSLSLLHCILELPSLEISNFTKECLMLPTAYILPVSSMLVMSIKAAFIDSSLNFETLPGTLFFCIKHTHKCSKSYTKSFTLMQSHKTSCIALLYQPKPPSHLWWSPQRAVPCNPVLCLSKTTLWHGIQRQLKTSSQLSGLWNPARRLWM